MKCSHISSGAQQSAARRARAHTGSPHKGSAIQLGWAGWDTELKRCSAGDAGQGALLRKLQAKHHNAGQQREVGEALHRAQQAGGAGGQAAAGLGLEGGEEGWRMELGGMRCCGC